jgi:hypothetical protein
MAIYRLTRTSQPNLAPASGSLVPGQLAVEMATQPNPRLWVGVPTNIDPTGRRLVVSAGGGGGGGGIPEAPTDGQIYGRDGETQLWEPVLPLSGGVMQGLLVLNGDATAAMDALPLGQAASLLGIGTVGPTAPTNPTEGETWFNTNTGQLLVWNGTQWVASQGFLSLGGGTMTGNLILDGPPSSASNPNQAATMGYVNSLITGALQFIGTIDGATGVVTYTESSAVIGSVLVNPSTVKDSFIICAVSGTIPSSSPYLAGTSINVGDWVISDGTEWYTISVVGEEVLAEDVAVSPTILGADNVQAALTALLNNFTLYAPLTSAALQGTPTTTTPPVGDYSLRIANTAWVEVQIQTALQEAAGNLDAILLIGELVGADMSIQGTGEFFDDITFQGDSTGTSGSTSPNYITSVVIQGDAT